MKFNQIPILIVLALQNSYSSADIIGGMPVSSGDLIQKSVVAFVHQTPKGESLCSASLLAEDIAVTAAHCIEDRTASQPEKDRYLLVFERSVRTRNANAVPIDRLLITDRWAQDNIQGSRRNKDQGDIALVHFSGGLPPGYRPMKIVEQPIVAGEAVVLAGYGISNAQTHSGAGTLRSTQVRVLEPALGETEMILDQSHGQGACHGDSGGPALLRIADELFLVGVTNRGYPNEGPDDCAHGVVYTKVTAYENWISAGMKKLREPTP